MSLFLEQSIPALLQAVDNGDLSVRDLAETTARHIAHEEPNVRAWVCCDIDRLRSAADRADAVRRAGGAARPLEGIPFGVKDIFNTRVFPTQMGSPIWRDFRPGNNARVVDSLEFAGALVAGKTVTAEFAVHALNATLNPHDPSRTPGTSSSGSAAAVATGTVPFALASQTAGSIARPASFCGVWGLKPSFGLIPRTGVLKTTDSLDSIGFVAAHLASLRVLLDCARVRGPDYPLVYRHVDRQGVEPKTSGRPWRVGFVKTHIWEDAADHARQAVEDLAARIARQPGFEVSEIDWPVELTSAHDVHATIYTRSLSYYFQNEAKKERDLSPIMREMIAAGESIGRTEFVTALRRQDAMSDTLDAVLAPYDLVLSLGTSSSAPLRGVEELADPALIWTMCRVPSVAAPLFRCPDGLPFGAQFIARRWSDYRLLQGLEALVLYGVLPQGSQEIRRALAAR